MMAGTYEIGANHFAGGGFMPSPATNAGSGSAQKRTYDGTVQTTRRLTVKQLADANVTETSAVDGKDLVNVSYPVGILPLRVVTFGFVEPARLGTFCSWKKFLVWQKSRRK